MHKLHSHSQHMQASGSLLKAEMQVKAGGDVSAAAASEVFPLISAVEAL